MLWFYKPSELVAKPLQFWPGSKQTYDERINSTSRFIIYSSLIVYAMKRDIRVIILMGVVIVGIFLIVKLAPHKTATASMISEENPLGNVLLTDYSAYPNRPATYADADLIETQMQKIFPSNTRVAERQFYTMPNTTIPNDQDAFLNFVYGGRRDNCKSDQSMCTPWVPDDVSLRLGNGRR